MSSSQHVRWLPQVFTHLSSRLLSLPLLTLALGALPSLAQQSSQEPFAARPEQTSVEQPKQINVAEESAQYQIAQLIARTYQVEIAQAQPAQEQPDPPSHEIQPAEGSNPATQEPPGGKRVFGVLPNYRTADATAVYMPITWKQKLTIASKDSFDYPLVLLAAAFAGLGQVTDQHPEFGKGLAGYGRRLGTAYADQAIGNMMTEGFIPILLHEDPRYFRRATGPKWGRTGYALTRIFVTHTDSGGTRFNYSEWVGNAIAVGISNAYYPDGRTVFNEVTKLLEQCGTDAVSQVLKEFWPDIKRRYFQRHTADH
jgi:hypothetical protein